ncbi:MAG: FtsX-like permease family protein [Solimicrobium sp.]|jgi:cell division transport system permease protein|nr:FtsX-like permease family protein [Solimicrobium sp.]
MKIWIRQHAAASANAVKQIISTPGNFIFNAIVVAIALSLPIMGLTLAEHIRPISAQLSINPELSLFLKTDVSRSDAIALADVLKKLVKSAGASAKVIFVPREAALAALQNGTGSGDLLAMLGDNPLPDAYVLSFEQRFEPIAQQFHPVEIEMLAKQLQKLPEASHVQIDSDWIKRLAALMSLLHLILIALAMTLSLVVITVVFNATRLQVLSHSSEMAVIRLLGATRSYICRPYYYTGALLGFIAGLAALALVTAALQPLNQAIIEFAKLYGSEFRVSPLDLSFSIYLLLASALLGLFGAFLSVRHQLNQIN